MWVCFSMCVCVCVTGMLRWEGEGSPSLPHCSRDDWHLSWHESTKTHTKDSKGYTYTHTVRLWNTLWHLGWHCGLQRSGSVDHRKLRAWDGALCKSSRERVWVIVVVIGFCFVCCSAAAALSGVCVGQCWDSKHCEVTVSLSPTERLKAVSHSWFGWKIRGQSAA